MAVDVTILTPSLPERASLLAECIESVAAQTKRPAGHLVALDYKEEGPATLRNRLMQMVQSEWVLFLDDDDYLHSDHLEVIEPCLVDRNDVVYTWCNIEGRNDVNWRTSFSAERLKVGNYIPVTVAVRTNLLKGVGGFPVGVAYEDWALWLRLLEAGAKFCNIPQVTWTYRWHGDNRSYVNDELVGKGEINAT